MLSELGSMGRKLRQEETIFDALELAGPRPAAAQL